MKTADIDHFRDELEKLGNRIQSHASSLAEQTMDGGGGKGSGELSNAPLHLGDMGTQEYIQDLNATFLQNEAYLANEVVAALRRLEEGTFGTCEGCGKSIPKGRLEAIPYARFCVECAEKLSSGVDVNMNEGRPRRPADTLAPEGDMNEDGHDEKTEDMAIRAGEPQGDVFAAGTAGGGTAVGGLAGSNIGHGDPDVADVNASTGSGSVEVKRTRREERSPMPRAGKSGGAVGGTPARKRAQ
jgi:DnaK suppressor protein